MSRAKFYYIVLKEGTDEIRMFGTASKVPSNGEQITKEQYDNLQKIIREAQREGYQTLLTLHSDCVTYEVTYIPEPVEEDEEEPEGEE